MSKLIVLSLFAGCMAMSAADNKVTFQYGFKKGMVLKTHLSVNTDMSMGKSALSMDTSMTVDDTKEDGTADLTTKIDSGDIKMMGMKVGIPGKGKEYHMTASKFGKTLQMSDKKMAVNLQEFPDHPIAVGESWDGSIQVQGGKGSFMVNAHFTFDSIKHADGHNLAHLLITEDGVIDGRGDMKVHATGWMDWDIDQGVPTAGHMEGTQDMGKMSAAFVSDQTTTVG